MVYTAQSITTITFSTFNTTLCNISTVLLCCTPLQRTWECDFLTSKVWRFTFLDNSGHVGRTRHQLVWPTVLETSPRYQEWFCKKSCFKDINNLSKGSLVGQSGVVKSWVSGNHVVIYRKVCIERRFSVCLVGNGHCATFIHFSLALGHSSMCWAMSWWSVLNFWPLKAMPRWWSQYYPATLKLPVGIWCKCSFVVVYKFCSIV